MTRWTARDIPRQDGRSAVITGTGGLGLETAIALARAGYLVIIAGRNPTKGAEAVEQVRAAVPDAKVSFEPVDLASLRSIGEFSTRLKAQRTSLDLLVNNAAVMNPPTRAETTDGLEMQFGTNYLGHFALTAHLLPLLRRGDSPRVVSLSSIAARNGKINFDDLQSTQSYDPMTAYRQSKLACLMFAAELQRRSDAGDWGITSVAAHPGISRTDLLHNAPGRRSPAGVARSLLWFLFQPADQGALPTLYAATSPDVKPSAYYGPSKLRELRGPPGEARLPTQATDTTAAARLWDESARLAGVSFAQADGRGL